MAPQQNAKSRTIPLVIEAFVKAAAVPLAETLMPWTPEIWQQ
jgi:hypothetical protein